MKIVVTGSLGHISKPLATQLVENGHDVTVLSSKAERQNDIEAIGAKAAIGLMEDVNFLTETFHGADIVYCMEASDANAFFDSNLDVVAVITQIGRNYQQAINDSGVKCVVHLSSIGAHLSEGIGLLRFHHNVENILRELPEDVSIKFMRPVGFYYSLLSFIPTIETQGAIVANYGGDTKEPWVSTLDIADAIAKEMERPFRGREIRYIASDEVSPNEIARILGEAINKPDLEWRVVSDEQWLDDLIATGMSPQTAKGYVEMNAARYVNLYEDYYRHHPELGQIKLKDYAKEFALVYDRDSAS